MPAEEMGNRRVPQTPDVATRTILLAAFGFLAFVAVTMGGLHLYYRWLVPGSLKTSARTFPEPRLQSSPQADYGLFRSAQREELAGYAWVDRERGIVRIPITDAMRLVAARGARAYEAPDQPEATPSPAKDAMGHR